jgi:hypothetical protein
MRFWVSGSALALILSGLAAAQTPKGAPRKTTQHKANELTLAGLRPGKDNVERAANLYRQFRNNKKSQDGESVWFDECRNASLTIDSGAGKRIREIRVAPWDGSTADCSKMPLSTWKTGLGLRLTDLTAKIVQLYGEPDSKSPSSKGGQQLELWYYAFDWAGPDVPQVMEVMCTVGQDGKPGRVVEITLAAPSL